MIIGNLNNKSIIDESSYESYDTKQRSIDSLLFNKTFFIYFFQKKKTFIIYLNKLSVEQVDFE